MSRVNKQQYQRYKYGPVKKNLRNQTKGRNNKTGAMRTIQTKTSKPTGHDTSYKPWLNNKRYIHMHLHTSTSRTR